MARRLRRDATEAETQLWRGLRESFPAMRFRRQRPIGRYVADFACPAQKLVIEVDGGQHATQEQADALLLQDVQNAVNHVNHLVTVTLTQSEFDALVDFAFNCGCGAFAGSTLLKLLNAGDYPGAAAQFDVWDHASGKVVAGLLRRREAETQEFATA